MIKIPGNNDACETISTQKEITKSVEKRLIYLKKEFITKG